MEKVDVKIINIGKQYLKWSFRPTFKREKQFCKGAIAIERRKCLINLIKPIYIGGTLLERKVNY